MLAIQPPDDRTMNIAIYFPSLDCTVDGVDATQVGPNRYRLNEAVMLIEDVGIFDVIETELIDDSTIKFIRVSESAGWVKYSWAVPKHVAESSALANALTKIEQNDGRWDRVFGGLLTVYIAPESDYDPTGEINAAFTESAGN